jgi:hypothetical protein
MRRMWTTAERNTIRRWHGRRSAAWIGLLIQRTAKSVLHTLKANPNLFVRRANGCGMAWDLVR